MASTDGTNNPASGGSQTPAMPTPISNVNAPPPFLVKTYEMVDNPAIDKIVSWSDTNNSFIVWDPPEFGRDVLPKYFKHNNFSSFVRQLNTYGFRKVDPDRWEFANEGFLRGQRHLLRTIVRRKSTHSQSQQPQQPHGQSSSVGACVEVGTFGLEEEVERLKRDKNVLMQELVRLRQQQQTTDNQLQAMVKRLHGMEQRQQQMMSFLAKAVNSPGFLSHFVQQQNENKRLTEGNKKRRIKPDDGQIVKYQPNVIEAAKALLSQIAKSDASPRLETFDCSTDSVIRSNMSSPLTASDHGSSPTHSSGGTLSNYPPISANSYVPSDSGVILSGPSTSISDIKAGVTSDALISAQLPDVISSLIGEHELPSVSLPSDDINILDICKFEEMISGSNVSNPSGSNGAFLDPASLDADQTMSLDVGSLSPDLGIDWDNNSYFDEMQVLNPVDPAWEQFLKQSLVHADGEAMDSTSEDSTQKNEVRTPDKEWSKAQMQRLTEQMDHLSSDNKKA